MKRRERDAEVLEVEEGDGVYSRIRPSNREER